MSFRSLYRHGFARVAACTTRTALADPLTNAQSILHMAQDCDRQAVAVAVFPELGISGYAISDPMTIAGAAPTAPLTFSDVTATWGQRPSAVSDARAIATALCI